MFPPGGVFPPGTTDIEKRSIAAKVPTWESANCTQCNICSFVCPHAAIRPVLATADELTKAPAGFQVGVLLVWVCGWSEYEKQQRRSES